MPERDFQADFDRAIRIIYDLKSTYLSQLLSEEAEVKKDFIRAELSQLDEKKRLLYSLDVDNIELFINELTEKYRLIQP